MKVKKIKKTIKKKIVRRRRQREAYLIPAKIVILFFIANVPVLFLLFALLPVSIAKSIPAHPCLRHVGTAPTYTWHVPATAYSSTPDQTDSTPFITADNTHVYWGVIAANFLPFDTCVRFPDSFGDKWFVVHDRKHERFSDSIDIWFPTREQARAFGIKIMRTEIWY